MQGDYDKAVEYFGRYYEICTQLNDPTSLHEARVQYGIARGHQLFHDYTSNINTCGAQNLERLIAWKDDRASVSKESKENSVGGDVGDVGDGSDDDSESVKQRLQDNEPEIDSEPTYYDSQVP